MFKWLKKVGYATRFAVSFINESLKMASAATEVSRVCLICGKSTIHIRNSYGKRRCTRCGWTSKIQE